VDSPGPTRIVGRRPIERLAGGRANPPNDGIITKPTTTTITKDKTMAKDIKISEVSIVDNKPLVKGTVGEEQFEATTLQWGGKLLIHVGTPGFDRGTRVAIGHAVKKNLRVMGFDLTPAPLKRPRKAKVEEAPVEVTIDLTVPLTVADPEVLDLVI
jgi:hypothetical protein